MKVEIEQRNNGFTVTYYEGGGFIKPPVYVYKATEDLYMWEEIARRFLKRIIKAVEQ